MYQDIAGQLSETAIPLRQPSDKRFFSKINAFCDAITNDGPPPIPTLESVYNQAICDGIYRSAQAGKEVEIELPKL